MISTAAQPPLASKAPWWLIASFAVSTLLALAWAAGWTLAVIDADYSSHPLENLTLNGVVWEAALAMLGLQTLALAGLYTRRHWGRAVASVAAVILVWLFSLPIWVVQGLAVVGLLQKHDWGAILAMVTSVLWILSGIGLPFGVARLILLWRWEHPALRPPAQRPQGAASTGVPA